MRIHVSFKKRLEQFFCKHDKNVGWSCCSKGVNRREGFWLVKYRCQCGFTYSKWINACDDILEDLFDKENHYIK